MLLDKIPYKDDNELLKLFQNAQKQKIKGNPRADDVLYAIQKTWKERLREAENGNYKATMPEKGMLSTFGYCVGASGVTEKSVRQDLLRLIFESDLPVVGSPAYTNEWGKRKSAKRFQKIHRTLSTLIFKNQNFDNMSQALEHWREDLDFISEYVKNEIE